MYVYYTVQYGIKNIKYILSLVDPRGSMEANMTVQS